MLLIDPLELLINCIEKEVGEYNSISISTDSWFCKNCILPNFTDSSIETNNKTTSDSESNTTEFDYVPVSALPTLPSQCNLYDAQACSLHIGYFGQAYYTSHTDF
jgi:hypothetical protein